MAILPTFQNPIFEGLKNSQNSHFYELFDNTLYSTKVKWYKKSALIRGAFLLGMEQLAAHHIGDALEAVVLVQLPVRGLVGDSHRNQLGAPLFDDTMLEDEVHEPSVSTLDVVVAAQPLGLAQSLGNVEATVALVENDNHFFVLLSLGLFLVPF